MSTPIKATIERMAAPIIEEGGYELVDVEYVKEGSNWFLRVYVDKPGGIDIDDCGKISEALSAKLDETDPIPNAYFLEVSSPGAERPLKKPDDFRRSIGKHVLVTTYEPVDGLKEFEGELQAYDEEAVAVQIGKKTYQIPSAKVAGARLAIKL